nr:hypothetical protein [Mucilaginibacter sp. SP1R1]MBB6151260.1 hypothetical protein [Mucilaginibacter sp. SP1R1]
MAEQSSTQKKNVRKWPIIILAVILIIAGTAYYFYKRYIAEDRWKPLLQQELKTLVLNATDSLYHIDYANFDLNVASGDATLTNFKLIPDTNIYNKLVALKKAPDNLFTLDVKKLSITGLQALKAYQEKILNIKNISIEKPNLTIVNKRYDFNDTVKVGKPKSPYELIKKTFKQLHIDSISLRDVSLNYVNKSNPVTKQTAIKNLDISIADIAIDSLAHQDPSRFYYTKGVEVMVHNYKIATPDSLYNAELNQISFSTVKRQIILDGVSFLPRYSRAAFYRKTGEPGDIFTMKFKQIAINDIDLQRFLRDQKLYAGTLDLNKANVEIYSNNRYKGPKSIKIGKDPHQALQKVALDMKLSRLNIRNTQITYLEADETSEQTGIILFKNTNGYILNVTNDADAKKLNPFMTAHISTGFMGAADLKVNFKFNLTAADGAFNYSGSLGKFDGRILDKLVKPLALVHVESADVERLTFNVNASNYYGKGHLEFYYKNLKIQLLKKKEGKAGLQKQGLISMLANDLVIEDNNPDKKGVFRPGPINLPRDPKVSFFSFLYKGLLDGLKPSVGFDKKTENKVNNAVTKVGNLLDKFSKFKADRKQKREERKKEKEAKKAAKEQEQKDNTSSQEQKGN